MIKGDLLFTAVFMRSGPAVFFFFFLEPGQKRDKNNLSRWSNDPKMVNKARIRPGSVMLDVSMIERLTAAPLLAARRRLSRRR